MPRNSTASSFAERLRRRTEEERKLLERYEVDGREAIRLSRD